MVRHPSNKNLTLCNDSPYEGLSVQIDKGPFIVEYLERLHQTIYRAFSEYPRVFAFRVDLRFPSDRPLPADAYTNAVIDRFLASFKAKIRHNRTSARLGNKYAHDTRVRYVWTREYGQAGKPHFHLAFLLNYDAFNTLGKFSPGRDNLFSRMVEAWASALGLPVAAVCPLVHIPENHYYHLRRDDLEGREAFFARASYLCKSATKEFGNGNHGFGCSRS